MLTSRRWSITKYTSYADRQEIITLHQQGDSYDQIRQQTGWNFETVRKICRSYQRKGESVLWPGPCRRPATGPLSSFDPLVRWASLRVKCQHPGWGPDVVLAELTKHPWAQRVNLPSASQIGVYFSQFGERLVTVRPHKQLPPRPNPSPPLYRWFTDAGNWTLMNG